MVGRRLVFSVAGGATFHQREPTHAGGGLARRHRAPLLHPPQLIGTVSHQINSYSSTCEVENISSNGSENNI